MEDKAGATAFSKLRSELDSRLDALPDGEGDRIRERTKAQLDAEIAAHDRSLHEIGSGAARRGELSGGEGVGRPPCDRRGRGRTPRGRS